MNFSIQLEKITAGERGADGIIFDFVLDNYLSRTATILSCEFHLWLRRPATGEHSFLDLLLPVSSGGNGFQSRLALSGESRLRLAWHCTPEQLQRVEDWRGGAGPEFELGSRVSFISPWQGHGASPPEPGLSGENHWFDEGQGMRFSVSRTQWELLLEQISGWPKGRLNQRQAVRRHS